MAELFETFPWIAVAFEIALQPIPLRWVLTVLLGSTDVH